MGYILPSIYKQICQQNGIECPKIFVETGTYKGGIPWRILMDNKSQLDDTFDKYYTVELDRNICACASYRYQMFEKYGENVTNDLIHSNDLDYNWLGVGQYFNGRLHLFEGDSAETLKDILPHISQRIAFWLDAHSGAQKYAKGTDDVALLRELEVIKKHPIKNHFIAIDDVHLFNTIQTDKKSGLISCDYTGVTIDLVSERIKDINPDYKIEIIAPFHMPMLIAYC